MTTTWQLLIWTNMLENDDNPSDLRTSYCQTSPHLWRFAIGSLSLGYLVALPRKSNLVEMAMSSFRQNTTRMVPQRNLLGGCLFPQYDGGFDPSPNECVPVETARVAAHSGIVHVKQSVHRSHSVHASHSNVEGSGNDQTPMC
jgi:hypothetical protein